MVVGDDVTRDDLVKLVYELHGQVEALESEIARLRAQLADQGGSGAPGSGKRKTPSFVKANRPAPADGAETKERKKRAENHGRKLETATEVVVHALETCPDCGRRLSEGWEHYRRQVIDIPALPYIVRDHVYLRHHCGVCRRDYLPQPDLSAEVIGKHRMSIGIMALVAYMRTENRMPLSAIQRQLQATYGLALSIGEIAHLLHTVAEQGLSQYEALLEELRSSAVVHADETSWRESGINGHLWGFLTPTIRWFVREQSRASAVPLGVLGRKTSRIVISDFYSGYSPLPCLKQRCWVHFLRDLKALEKDYPKNRRVAAFRARIRGLYEKAVAYRMGQLALEGPVPMRILEQRVRVREKFENALMKLAQPHLGRQKNPCRLLAERVQKFLYEFFVFVEHPVAPPENNLAERALRPTVIARKISGGTRSPRGSQTMAILRSLFGTWDCRGLAPLDACLNLLTPAAP